jgi:FkbM family methyltransferase
MSQGVPILRTMAERILGEIVVRRRLPRSVGAGVVVANAKVGGLRYLFRPADQLDPVLCRVAGSTIRRGDVVWDVGANVGLFSAIASGLVGHEGQVFAFEPDRDAYALLARTAKARLPANGKIVPVNTALSNRCGLVSFDIAKRARSLNSITGFGYNQVTGVVEQRILPALSLDSMLDILPAPAVLKIDVEGAEVLALEGAERVLGEMRPRVVVEVADERSIAVSTLLARHNYVLFDGSTSTRVGIGLGAPWDTVAIPGESADAFDRSLHLTHIASTQGSDPDSETSQGTA